jgi:hypothetical protein
MSYIGPTTMNALAIRQRLGTHRWEPPEEFGPDGWSFCSADRRWTIIVSCADHDGAEYLHASIASADHSTMPSYEQLCDLHHAVWGTTGFAYQVFAPRASHVNIHPTALHLWGRSDGEPALPDFGMFGTI